MDALILSCSTGGGHNAAGFAIKEELEYRGHRVTMMDPYELVSHKLATEVGNVYVKMVQRSPKFFGFIYSLGSLVRKVPGKSPVYYANIAVAKKIKYILARASGRCDSYATSVSGRVDHIFEKKRRKTTFICFHSNGLCVYSIYRRNGL